MNGNELLTPVIFKSKPLARDSRDCKVSRRQKCPTAVRWLRFHTNISSVLFSLLFFASVGFASRCGRLPPLAPLGVGGGWTAGVMPWGSARQRH